MVASSASGVSSDDGSNSPPPVFFMQRRWRSYAAMVRWTSSTAMVGSPRTGEGLPSARERNQPPSFTPECRRRLQSHLCPLPLLLRDADRRESMGARRRRGGVSLPPSTTSSHTADHQLARATGETVKASPCCWFRPPVVVDEQRSPLRSVDLAGACWSASRERRVSGKKGNVERPPTLFELRYCVAGSSASAAGSRRSREAVPPTAAAKPSRRTAAAKHSRRTSREALPPNQPRSSREVQLLLPHRRGRSAGLAESVETRPALQQLIHSSDEEVVTDACWALSYLSDGTNDKIQAVIDSGLCSRLVELLQHPSSTVIVPPLRAVGNIVTGDDMQTQAVIEANIFGPLVNLLQNGEFDIKKEAAWAISNATSGGSHDQIK
nr:Importin subunit alpha-1 [Ipomoea batatas]